MKAQTLGNAESQPWMKAQKILEINPFHPLIKELKKRFEDDSEDQQANVDLLFETAMLSSGFPVSNPNEFAQNIHGVIAQNLGVGLEFELEAEEPLEVDGDEEEEDEEDDEEEEGTA